MVAARRSEDDDGRRVLFLDVGSASLTAKLRSSAGRLRVVEQMELFSHELRRRVSVIAGFRANRWVVEKVRCGSIAQVSKKVWRKCLR